ncbi:hypothetical protein [Micromonospora parathelypteridis]|uniref:Uncharacterized protein n=1 Tax=Micromonospora parathelypteridis TaxID=1839617 RepID=A0A840VWP2_9ACTN|nr:hypothetical protein [Micromonospora parathelypteridis]MBB5481037.1 hypothetical protein [Micromonospora parathelypteridis]
MTYVEIDIQGARALGQVLRDTATRTETVRRQTLAALKIAELTGQAPLQLALVQDGFATLGTGINGKADLAERFTIDPRGTATTLGATEADLGGALSTLLGFAGPRDLRGILLGLPGAGANTALDAALARLTPLLLPAQLGGQRPALTDEQLAALLPDLQVLALALGIEHVGPPVRQAVEQVEGRGFLGFFRRAVEPRTTEVFWQDFWADGRSVADVLADPGRLLQWINGTVELDHRLARAVDLPQLGDVLASHDFATANSAPTDLAAMLAAAEVEFAAIANFLPAFLTGRTTDRPDTTQLAQTLAFAARVGWVDPGVDAATPEARFESAVAYLRGNRMLQSALLPTGFEGDTDPFAIPNEAGIALTVEFGRESGVVTDAYVAGIAELAGQLMSGVGVDLTSTTPIALTEAAKQRLFALVASQVPRTLAQSPSIQAQFVGALSYLGGAADGPQLRERIVQVVAAFRTLAVVGGPALTERELTAVVGGNVVEALGRGRLRMRTKDAVEGNPEFLILLRQWGIPASRKQDVGKYTFRFTFDALGVLTDVSRKKKKKKGLLSRIVDTVKSVGKAIVSAWKDNPFKAIFQIGKIALGVASLVVPGLQALGVATLAINAAEAVSHAIDGNWLGAIGAGLSAFTAGADLLGTAAGAASLVGQSAAVGDLLDVGDTLSVLRNAKRAFDISASIIQATRADSLLGAINAGFGAAASTLGNGGQLLGSLGVIDQGVAGDLVRLGVSVRDASRLVAPAAGLVQALDQGDPLSALGNGLSVVSAGALALANPGGTRLFDFDARTRGELASLGTGTGIVGNLARAIAAADAGRPALALQAVAQAGQLADRTSRGAVVAERVADVGVVLEGVFNGVNPALAAPIVMQRLDRVIQALKPSSPAGQPAADSFDLAVGAPAPLVAAAPLVAPASAVSGTSVASAVSGTSVASAESAETVVDLPAQTLDSATVTLAGGSGVDTLVGGHADDLILAQATTRTGGGTELRMPDGRVIPLPSGTHVIPPGAQIVTPDGDVYGGPGGLVPSDPGAFAVPGGFPAVPGRILVVPEDRPGPPTILFFPDNPDGVPQSRLDGSEGIRVAGLASTDTLTDGDPIGLIPATPAPRDGSDAASDLPAVQRVDLDLRDPFFEVPRPPAAEPHLFELLFRPRAVDESPYVWAASENPAFVPNHILDGGSRTTDTILNSFGWGRSVQGLYDGSESVYLGWKSGYALNDSDAAPVDGFTVGGSLGLSAQFGHYGFVSSVGSEVNFGPLLRGELPDVTNDTLVGLNIPYLGAIGFRATNDALRAAEQSDFSDGFSLGPGALLSMKFPTQDIATLYNIAEMAGVSVDDVLNARTAPSGTMLAFDVREQFDWPGDAEGGDRPATNTDDGLPPLASLPMPSELAMATNAHQDGVPQSHFDRAYDTMVGLSAPPGTDVTFDDAMWEQFTPSFADDAGVPSLLGPALDSAALAPELDWSDAAFDDFTLDSYDFDADSFNADSFNADSFNVDSFEMDSFDVPEPMDIPDGFSVDFSGSEW